MFEEGQRLDEFACFSERTVVKLNYGAQATSFFFVFLSFWGTKRKECKSFRIYNPRLVPDLQIK